VHALYFKISKQGDGQAVAPIKFAYSAMLLVQWTPFYEKCKTLPGHKIRKPGKKAWHLCLWWLQAIPTIHHLLVCGTGSVGVVQNAPMPLDPSLNATVKQTCCKLALEYNLGLAFQHSQ
jgi:hypothetical protein